MDGLAFRFGEMHSVLPIARIPNIHFMRSNVQVANKQYHIGEVEIRIEIFSQASDPFELKGEFVTAEFSAVRHVDVYDANAVDRSGDQSSRNILHIVGKIPMQIFDRMFRYYCDAVICFFAVKFDMGIPDGSKFRMRKLRINAF